MRSGVKVAARIAPVLAGLLLVVGCGSDSGKSGETASKDKGTVESVRDALGGCKELPEGQQGISKAKIYDCTVTDRDDLPVYLYVFDDEAAQDNYVAYLKKTRGTETGPRGAAEHGTWILDTNSPKAIEIAKDEGAEVLFPANEN